MLMNNSTGGDKDLQYTSIIILDIDMWVIIHLYHAALITSSVTVSAYQLDNRFLPADCEYYRHF